MIVEPMCYIFSQSFNINVLNADSISITFSEEMGLKRLLFWNYATVANAT